MPSTTHQALLLWTLRKMTAARESGSRRYAGCPGPPGQQRHVESCHLPFGREQSLVGTVNHGAYVDDLGILQPSGRSHGQESWSLTPWPKVNEQPAVTTTGPECGTAEVSLRPSWTE